MKTLTPLLLPLLLLLASCQKSDKPDALFPLDAGHQWTYRVSSQVGDEPVEVEALTLRTLGRESLAGLGDVPSWHRRSDNGIDYWLRADETGIFRVGSKSDIDPEVKPDRPIRFVLKAPMLVGTAWTAPTTAYLLARRNEFPREIRHTHPNIPMSFRIEALNEKVVVAAGKFDGCLRVKGEALLRIAAVPAPDFKDLILTQMEWFCPGVGLVKMTRSEPAGSMFLTGGTRNLELMSWD